MNPEVRPLHVQVAEAIGWRHVRPATSGITLPGRWVGQFAVIGQEQDVPDYDTDWSATGPLIERYLHHVQRHEDGWFAFALTEEDGAFFGDAGGQPTPLLAVCHLILALHAAGKLREEQREREKHDVAVDLAALSGFESGHLAERARVVGIVEEFCECDPDRDCGCYAGRILRRVREEGQ